MREEAKTDNVNYKVKLPKLLVIKFNNTHLDWFCYQNQFESEVKKSELSPVSKCSCMKELVSTKFWSLPHTNNFNPYKIHVFTEKLLSSVQALKTI